MNTLSTFSISIYLLVINVVTFLVYGFDKSQSKNYGRRVPESVMMFLAIAGGSVGAWLAMKFFRHKTMHMLFYMGIPIIIIVQIFLAGYFGLDD